MTLMPKSLAGVGIVESESWVGYGWGKYWGGGVLGRGST